MNKNIAGVKKVCIITTRHISYNPRVLKEADALVASGFNVSVVTVNNHLTQSKFDGELMQTRKWKLRTVNFRREVSSEKATWMYLSFKQKIYQQLAKLTPQFGIAERAMCKGFDELLTLAEKEAAQFYIVHHAEALGVGYLAAKNTGAQFGFDAEDFHTGMDETGEGTEIDNTIGYLEKKYLTHCNYFTAASTGIMRAYQKKYGIKKAITILNVFPLQPSSVLGLHQPIRFYWYSQSIGPKRSLEILMQAAAAIQEPFELHLRGTFHDEAYKKLLEDLIQANNLDNKVFFHAPILAQDIINDASQFDVGLALESDVSVNRNICVTNKIFSYLMSGLAIIGTDTLGQKDIFSHFEKAVYTCRQNNMEDLKKAMLFFITNPDVVLRAKEAARQAAENRFNWEAESQILIQHLKSVVDLKQMAV